MRLLRYVFEEMQSRTGNFSLKYLSQVVLTLVYWTAALFVLAELYAYFDVLDKSGEVSSGLLAGGLILAIAVSFVIYAFLLDCLNAAKKRIAKENEDLLNNIRNPK